MLDRPIDINGLRWIHRLIFLRYDIPPDSVLNAGRIPVQETDSLAVAADLRQIANALKEEAFDTRLGRIDYSRVRHSPAYAEYRDCARLLQVFDPESLKNAGERLAFWINLYNALVVDAVIQLEVDHTVAKVPGFFWRAAYAIGGRRYAAMDIEYGILRANAPHPAIPGHHFGARDPRRALSLRILDPGIHFALVCAARSCPPISVYDPDKIDGQLELATRSFINHGGVQLDRNAGVVYLSKIFQWYAPDFGAWPLGIGNRQPLLDFIAGYMVEDEDRHYLQANKVSVRFLPYDWTLNSKENGESRVPA